MIREVESVATLDAEEVSVRAALVAVIAADNFHSRVGAAHSERGFAAVAAMRADSADVLHLPRTGLVAICAGSQGTDGANVDTHAAFFALEMVFLVGSN